MADEVKKVKETKAEEKKTRRVIPIEEKIAQAEKKVAFYEKNLASAKRKLSELKMKQDKNKKDKAIEMIMQSGKSWDEVMDMFK